MVLCLKYKTEKKTNSNIIRGGRVGYMGGGGWETEKREGE